MKESVIISAFIFCVSGCSLFTDPQKLEKVEQDLSSDAIQIIEDIQEPSAPEAKTNVQK